jgi:excisionase family DNA binding protein
LTVKAVAARLGVSTATVYKLCDRRALPSARIMNSIRVRASDLRLFLKVRLRGVRVLVG